MVPLKHEKSKIIKCYFFSIFDHYTDLVFFILNGMLRNVSRHFFHHPNFQFCASIGMELKTVV